MANESAVIGNKSGNGLMQINDFDASIESPSSICVFPSYFNYFAILILIAIAIVTQLSHLTRIILMMLFSGVCKIDFIFCMIAQNASLSKIQLTHLRFYARQTTSNNMNV
jgi:hypothetical protein